MVKAPGQRMSTRERVVASAKVRAHLAERPQATIEELAKAAGCSTHFVSVLRAAWAHRDAVRRGE